MGKGQFLLVVFLVEAVLVLEMVALYVERREGNRSTWDKIITVGIEPRACTICLAT